MSTKNVADILFCIDASDSMKPCFDALISHLNDLINSLRGDGGEWDIRLDFISQSVAISQNDKDTRVFKHNSAMCNDVLTSLYNKTNPEDYFFTSDRQKFLDALSGIECMGDEAMLVALDTAIDFPWRHSAECHRVLIFLTDEPCETNVDKGEKYPKIINDIISKIQERRIMLFIVAPESQAYDHLSQANLCEYKVIDSSNDGFRKVNFSKIMEFIGRSVSVAEVTASISDTSYRALYGQDKWTGAKGEYDFVGK